MASVLDLEFALGGEGLRLLELGKQIGELAGEDPDRDGVHRRHGWNPYGAAGGEVMAGFLPSIVYRRCIAHPDVDCNRRAVGSIASGREEETMADAKFKPTAMSVTEFLTKLEDPQKRADSKILVEMMTRLTGKKPRCGSPGIVGFGEYHYKYAVGPRGRHSAGRASRRARPSSRSILMAARTPKSARACWRALGKHRMGKGCLYVKRLDQVDLGCSRAARPATRWRRAQGDSIQSKVAPQ